jgi:Flp pilus assembly pilin Flp
VEHPPHGEIAHRQRRSNRHLGIANRSDNAVRPAEAGQTLVEYALILSFLSISIIGTTQLIDFAFPDLGGGLVNAISGLAS